MAWNKVCLKKVFDEDAAELEAIFKKDDWFEERQSTLLHKIVLDLLPTRRSLPKELFPSQRVTSKSRIRKGRTPLSWAAEMGNLSAVQTLLHYGAVTSSKPIMGFTPLRYAAKAHDPSCLNALLEEGAFVSAKNKWNQSPLNIASYFQNYASYVQNDASYIKSPPRSRRRHQ